MLWMAHTQRINRIVACGARDAFSLGPQRLNAEAATNDATRESFGLESCEARQRGWLQLKDASRLLVNPGWREGQ